MKDIQTQSSQTIIIDMGRLEDWPITHLRRTCQKNKIKGYSKMSKEDLVLAVREILKKFHKEKEGEDK